MIFFERRALLTWVTVLAGSCLLRSKYKGKDAKHVIPGMCLSSLEYIHTENKHSAERTWGADLKCSGLVIGE